MIIRIGALTNKNDALGLRRQFSKGQGEQEDNERLATARRDDCFETKSIQQTVDAELLS